MFPSARRRTLVVCSFFLLLVLLRPAACQQDSVPVSGEVTSTGSTDGLMAEIYDASHHSVLDRSEVRFGGHFAFDRVPAGQYQLRIVDLHGEVVEMRWISVRTGLEPIKIRLTSREESVPAGGTISVARLQHQVPPRAVKELKKELQALDAGDLPRAVAHLEKALQIDPEYMEAYNNLGACYMRLGRFPDALAAFRKAAELDPGAARPLANLADTYSQMRQFDAAETAARHALALDPGMPLAHFELARALAVRGLKQAEAIREFDRAATEYPQARLFLAKLLMASGARDRAVGQLQEYLRTPEPENRTAVESWLKRLSPK